MRASPTTIGDTASGRSIRMFSSRRPGKRYRASSSAMPIPNTTLRSTAMPETTPVSTIACTTVGSAIVSQNVPNPCWIVRHRTTPSGTRTSTPTYPTAIPRKAYVPVRRGRRGGCVGASPRSIGVLRSVVAAGAIWLTMAGRPSLDDVKQADHDQADDQEGRGRRSRCGEVIVLDLAVHVHRRDLGLE